MFLMRVILLLLTRVIQRRVRVGFREERGVDGVVGASGLLKVMEENCSYGTEGSGGRPSHLDRQV